MALNGRWLLLALTFATLGIYHSTAALLIPPQFSPEQSAAAEAFAQLGIWNEDDGGAGLTFQSGDAEGGNEPSKSQKVPVDLAVMSQCPDTQVTSWFPLPLSRASCATTNPCAWDVYLGVRGRLGQGVELGR
jgi:hypothetical protein